MAILKVSKGKFSLFNQLIGSGHSIEKAELICKIMNAKIVLASSYPYTSEYQRQDIAGLENLSIKKLEDKFIYELKKVIEEKAARGKKPHYWCFHYYDYKEFCERALKHVKDRHLTQALEELSEKAFRELRKR